MDLLRDKCPTATLTLVLGNIMPALPRSSVMVRFRSPIMASPLKGTAAMTLVLTGYGKSGPMSASAAVSINSKF